MKNAIIFLVMTVSVMTVGLTHSFAFKAPDENKNSGVTQKKRDLSDKDASRRSTTLGLSTTLKRNLNLPVKGDDVEAAIRSVAGLMKAPGMAVVLKKSQSGKLGFRHIRLSQRYKGLPVVGAELIVHINNQNVIYMTNGKCLTDTKVSIKPDIDSASALQVGLDEHKGKAGLHVSKEPSLVIYGSYLAYHYVISYSNDEDVGQWWYYVDAHTGKLISRYNNIQHAVPDSLKGTGITVEGDRLAGEDGSHVTMTGFHESDGSENYFLYNFSEFWGVYDTDVRDWEQQFSPGWGVTDRAAISCGYNFEKIQLYVTDILEWNSFDNAGAFARANVHQGTNYVNAYWDGTDFHFGDGDGSTSNELCVLDVAAHEYGHAITDSTSGLIYQDESGALNESYSDIMGACVEFASQLPSASASVEPGHSDWLLGEDCWLPPGSALRDLQYPQNYWQPSYYKGTFWYTGTGDNGGVHYNSGVQNFAFYLLAEGGSGDNDGHPYDPIEGIGIVEACEVAMLANTAYLSSASQYIDSREAWISAATELGYSVATVEAVWDACGVVPPPPPCDNPFFTEDFETWPPAGWTVVNNGGDCVWDSNANTGGPNNTNNTGGSGNCAFADSDFCSITGTNDITMDTELWTPLIDLFAVTSATLEFKTEYLDYLLSPVDVARVDISTNGGTSWTNLLTWNTWPGQPGPYLVQLDLTPYVGSPFTIIRFHYVAEWDHWWKIDDVSICGDGCSDDKDGDGHVSEACGGDDCNDTDETVYPGAPELCDDGIDNDCDGTVDNQTTYYEDFDGDGFGNADVSRVQCAQPVGYVSDNTDCDDADPARFPGNPDICDGIDNNCNGQVDEGFDIDGDGITSCGGDCDDADPERFPGNPEVCDGKDNNCDGQTDENLPTSTFYRDFDGDGYGDPTDSVQDCEAPPGYVSDNTDCDDSDASINPGAAEVCGNTIDENCDGNVNEGCGGLTDADGDGYYVEIDDCDDNDPNVYPGRDADDDGYVDAACGGDDCDDTNPSVHPGACDIKRDGIDQDCDGADRTKGKPCPDSGGGCTDDKDSDGYVSKACGGDDCNDADASINPGAVEVCGNDIDENCDGNVNEGCGGELTDADGDGYYAEIDDCNDDDASINPGATEICDDGIDNDCDRKIDCADKKDCRRDPACQR